MDGPLYSGADLDFIKEKNKLMQPKETIAPKSVSVVWLVLEGVVAGASLFKTMAKRFWHTLNEVV